MTNKTRIRSADQARAIAIAAMIWAHFGPGLLSRLPIDESTAHHLVAPSRVATPVFAAIFGFMIGLAYMPKAIQAGPFTAVRALRKRSLVVGVCAILTSLPSLIDAVIGGRTGSDLLYPLYSVLLFYCIAVASIPYWLKLLAKSPFIHTTALVAGLTCYTLSFIVRDILWPPSATRAPGVEFIRLLLFSGKYAYFSMMGTALIAVPFGLDFRQRIEAGDRQSAIRGLTFAGLGGIAVALAGYIWQSHGRLDVLFRLFQSDVAGPCYYLGFGGLGLLLIAGFQALNDGVGLWSTLGYPLALFGQCSLAIYTMHCYVLPLAKSIDGVYKIEGPGRALLPLSLFTVSCAAIMYRRAARNASQQDRCRRLNGSS